MKKPNETGNQGQGAQIINTESVNNIISGSPMPDGSVNDFAPRNPSQ
jgi:hypothetical protein